MTLGLQGLPLYLKINKADLLYLDESHLFQDLIG